MNMFSLENKIALVFGGNGYLGKQFCKSLCFIDNLDVVEFDKFLVCIDLEGVSSLEKIWESRKYSSDVMCYVGFKSIKEEITFWIFLFS